MKQGERSPLDIAADVFVYAPVGLAIELSKHLPDFAKQGREQLAGPIAAAKFVGNMAAQQGRTHFGESLRKATEPIFGDAPPPATGAPPKPAQPAQPATAPPSRSKDLPIAGYE